MLRRRLHCLFVTIAPSARFNESYHWFTCEFPSTKLQDLFGFVSLEYFVDKYLIGNLPLTVFASQHGGKEVPLFQGSSRLN